MKRFEERIWISSPTMHGEEIQYMKEAYDTNWMSTVGHNINEVERLTCEKTGSGYAVALTSGTAALHMAVKLAGEKLYGPSVPGQGALAGHRVFCSDMTFDATVNPVIYEGGVPVFIDEEYETWNMDPDVLEQAFQRYPDVRIVIIVHLYGIPGKIQEIQEICRKHDAILIEDSAEALGSVYCGQQAGTFGTYSAISFNGNKIITGSAGGMFLTGDQEAAGKVRKWSTQSRENAPWYEHEELGYNYRMSNVVAGVVRGQYPYLGDHIAKKRAIYEQYLEGFKDLPVTMNPYDREKSEPNFWLSCMLIDPEAMCHQVRTEREAFYETEPGKSCPTEILEKLAAYNVEGRPIWKPMHMQPYYKNNDYLFGNKEKGIAEDVGESIFARGLCLPSDIKMTEEQQDQIIEMIHSCFQ